MLSVQLSTELRNLSKDSSVSTPDKAQPPISPISNAITTLVVQNLPTIDAQHTADAVQLLKDTQAQSTQDLPTALSHVPSGTTPATLPFLKQEMDLQSVLPICETIKSASPPPPPHRASSWTQTSRPSEHSTTSAVGKRQRIEQPTAGNNVVTTTPAYGLLRYLQKTPVIKPKKGAEPKDGDRRKAVGESQNQSAAILPTATSRSIEKHLHLYGYNFALGGVKAYGHLHINLITKLIL